VLTWLRSSFFQREGKGKERKGNERKGAREFIGEKFSPLAYPTGAYAY